jgi:SAM-dependent methyltransferase
MFVGTLSTARVHGRVRDGMASASTTVTPTHTTETGFTGRQDVMDMGDAGYSEGHVAYYDAVFETSDREDVDFYVDRAQAADGPVLELACGTGRIYLPMLRAGVDADGIDLSKPALDALRGKAAEAGLDPSVRQADMADFSVDRAYDLVICPFNAVQHLLSVEEQLTALESVHDALAPGGAFVFDVFVPSFDVICETYGDWHVEERTVNGDPHEMRTRTRLIEEVEQQIAVETEVSAADGELVVDDEFHLKLLPKREIELLAHLSPFEDWSVAGGFDGGPLEDGEKTQVWTLRA